MKKTRRIAAMIAALAMMATMAVPSFMMTAGAFDVTISDNGNVTAKNHSFSAYQLFTGTPNTGKTAFTGTSETVDWGSAIAAANRDAFISTLKTNFPNATTYPKIDALKLSTDAEGQSSAYTVAEALSELTDPADATKLAGVIDTFITTNTPAAEGSYTAASGDAATISDLDGGYYFIKDTTAVASPGNDAVSKFILKVVGDQTVTIKTDAPTLDKKIWHNDGSATPNTADNTAPTFNDGDAQGWADVGDNQIGDTVYYCIKTYIPDMTEYVTYKYQINDTLSTGLTFDTTTGVNKIEVFNKSGTYICDLTAETTETDVSKPNVTMSANSLTVNFVDLKACLDAVDEHTYADFTGGYIYTYYQATLNANAFVSAGLNSQQNNPNTAYLTYSNNPNQSGSGTHTTSDTPSETVYDWTYTYEIDKVDESGDPLAGATFEVKVGDDVQYFVPLSGAALTTALANVKTADDTPLTEAADTLYYRIAKSTDDGATTVIGSTSDVTHTKYYLIGLDDTKTYAVTETNAPATYSKKSTADNLTITNDYSTAGNELTQLNSANATGVDTVYNYKNSELPSTGGMGTTLFVVGGGVTAAAAAIYLVSKKRAKDAE